MRIALFLPQLGVSGGLGVYCRCLLDGLLRTHWDASFDVVAPAEPRRLFPHSGLDDGWRALVSDRRVRLVSIDWPDGFPLSLALDHVLAEPLARARPDVVHCTYYTGLERPPCPQVITFHDAGFLEAPKVFGETAQQRRETFARIAPAVRRLVCVSADARARVCRLLPFDLDRADVVHLALSDPPEALARARCPERLREPLWPEGDRIADWGPYLLVPVGAATGFNRVRKNVPLAVAAFESLRSSGTTLVIASTGILHPKLLGELLPASTLPAGAMIGGAWRSGDAAVRVVPNLDRDPFLAAMAHAQAVVYPTRFEGFGLPSVEAMALGVPLIAGRATSIPEVVGDAGILVDPDDVPGFAAAFRRVLTDSVACADLVRRGKERVKQFTLERLGSAMVEVYRRVVDEGPSVV